MPPKGHISSGVSHLDLLLDGLHIGDNVVWHDDAGSLASVFCLNFIHTSLVQKKPLIYVTFDRSPKNLLDKLGSLGHDPLLTILDGFTHGKGAGSEVFLKFYKRPRRKKVCRIRLIENPRDPQAVMDSLYSEHSSLKADVRFVFESLTGMQEIWGGEDKVLGFYSHSCPRLYELNTIAYWILEKRAHSPRLRAQINQIAQVAIDMRVKRGTTYLTVLKAENRSLDTLNKPFRYWTKDLHVTFDPERGTTGRLDLGQRLKAFRNKRGLSQKELATLVGVTPSTISQVESNLIYPSLPALLKISDILTVNVSSFFQDTAREQNRVVFPGSDAADAVLDNLSEGTVRAKALTPIDSTSRTEAYLLELLPKQSLTGHFFLHKGEEMGYVLSGKLRFKTKTGVFTAGRGDLIHLTSEIPLQWNNVGKRSARILWIKIS
ncbi:MAG: helix-turn-helix domain-containing protein [Desulfobacteraceae bacterium]|jgi:transcriptional regulator with XRE-family HTH domain